MMLTFRCWTHCQESWTFFDHRYLHVLSRLLFQQRDQTLDLVIPAKFRGILVRILIDFQKYTCSISNHIQVILPTVGSESR
jgi:hypothetical protein